MSIVKKVNMIEVHDWNKLVRETYDRPYDFQQQDGCKSRGIFNISIPDDYTQDDEMHDDIPEVVNGEIMGIKFKKWIDRDPKMPLSNQKFELELTLFWERNFYPSIQMVANDLHEKGLIDAGKYIINIDW